MTIALSDTAKNRRLLGLLEAIDLATNPATMELWSGTRPAAGGTPTGSLQATITLGAVSATVTGTAFSWVVPKEGQRVDDLDITWVRIKDGDGNWVVDGTAGLIGDPDADFHFDQISGNIGAFVRLSGGGFTE